MNSNVSLMKNLKEKKKRVDPDFEVDEKSNDENPILWVTDDLTEIMFADKTTAGMAFTTKKPDTFKVIKFSAYEEAIAKLAKAEKLVQTLKNVRHQLVGFKGNSEIIPDIDNALSDWKRYHSKGKSK
jgi:hypothetical protein